MDMGEGTIIQAKRYRLVLHIPELPVIAPNAREHWRDRHRATQHWDGVIFWHTAGKRPPTPLARAELTLIRRSSVCPDWDNLAASFKHPVDALVSAGILKDDCWKVIGMPHFSWEKAPAHCGSITMVVESIESD